MSPTASPRPARVRPIATGLLLLLVASLLGGLAPPATAICPTGTAPGAVEGAPGGNCLVKAPATPAPPNGEYGSENMPASDSTRNAPAHRPLHASRHNYQALADGNWDNRYYPAYLRYWDCVGQPQGACKRGGNQLAFRDSDRNGYGSVERVWLGGKYAEDVTRVCDTEPDCKECVSFVQAVALDKHLASTWKPGTPATAGTLPLGAAIATFNKNGKYGPPRTTVENNGHTGILGGYKLNSAGDVVGIIVYDQNWGGDGLVKRHTISVTGSGTKSDAATYFQVLVPA